MAPELIPRIGDHIELLAMPNDPDPIPVGEHGIVERIMKWNDRQHQIIVKWDSGRTLALVIPPDQVRILATDT